MNACESPSRKTRLKACDRSDTLRNQKVAIATDDSEFAAKMRFSIVGVGWRCLWPQRIGICLHWPFSTSSRVSITYRKWTADEDNKLKELSSQKLSVPNILTHLPGRSADMVTYRLKRLRDEPKRRTSSAKVWTAHEDWIILKKRNEGLQYSDIELCLPGRSKTAIVHRHWRIKDQPEPENISSGPYTEEEKAAIIDLKVNHGLTLRAIARKLKRTTGSTTQLWDTQLRPQLSERTIENMLTWNGWKPEEDAILRKLHREGIPFTKMSALNLIPGKSLKAINTRARSLPLPRKTRPRATRAESEAMRHALKPVLEGHKTFDEVFHELPNLSTERIMRVYYKMRRGEYKTELTPSVEANTND